MEDDDRSLLGHSKMKASIDELNQKESAAEAYTKVNESLMRFIQNFLMEGLQKLNCWILMIHRSRFRNVCFST